MKEIWQEALAKLRAIRDAGNGDVVFANGAPFVLVVGILVGIWATYEAFQDGEVGGGILCILMILCGMGVLPLAWHASDLLYIPGVTHDVEEDQA